MNVRSARRAIEPLTPRVFARPPVGMDRVLLVASERTVFEAQAEPLSLPGVDLASMIGGQNEPEAWYQPNEIVRQFAKKVGGHPQFHHAPALPERDLQGTLMKDPSIAHVFEMWRTTRCAVVGVGPPPLCRASIPNFLPIGSPNLRKAVGDICSRSYNRHGRAVQFPGSDRMISTPHDEVRNISVTIAVAADQTRLRAWRSVPGPAASPNWSPTSLLHEGSSSPMTPDHGGQ